MTMWRSPGFNEELLKKYGCQEDIYNAMRSSDLGDVVYTALDIIKKTGSVPLLINERKSDAKSTDFRRQGNQAYLSKKYHEALVLYNKALKYAPNKSRAMKLAYSNRSALFITVKAYSACSEDIDTCFDMGCPPEIESKLHQRQREAFSGIDMEDSYWLTVPKFANGFFKLIHEPRNPQISSATMDVGVIIEKENNIPKIVAARDVKVGTVLAVDPAFVTHMDSENLHISCYNCQKLEYNLMPCEGCCYVMFCDQQCMNECMSQYHTLECKLMGLFEATGCTVKCSEKIRLAVKAAIRLKRNSTWKELIADSKVYGTDRIKNSTIGQIYDFRENLSLLTFKEDKHFIYGTMYNASFVLAAIIYYMAKTDFLPYDYKERQEAIKCFGRFMMYLTLFGTPTVISDTASINNSPQIESHEFNNFGLFSLVGKLRNSCRANTMTVGLNEKVAIVALQPIARGTEITVTYLGHWLDNVTDGASVRNQNMFALFATVCNCIICSGEWERRTDSLTPSQLACYNRLHFQDIDFQKLSEIYKNICKTLTKLHNVPFSKEYVKLYRHMRTCLMHLQHVNTENVVLERIHARNRCCHSH